MGEQAVAALRCILTSEQALIDQPSEADQSEQIIEPSQASRILAEIRTR